MISYAEINTSHTLLAWAVAKHREEYSPHGPGFLKPLNTIASNRIVVEMNPAPSGSHSDTFCLAGGLASVSMKQKVHPALTETPPGGAGATDLLFNPGSLSVPFKHSYFQIL